MTQESKKGRSSWWWILGGAAGLAFIMMAILLWSSGPGNPGTPVAQANDATATPTAIATLNPNCDLKVTKSDSPDPVAEGGEITYTIKVENNGSGNGECTSHIIVKDTIPTDTDCVSIDVTEDADLDVNYDDDDCAASGTIEWDIDNGLETDDEVVLQMVVELTSGAEDGDTIENEACAASTSDVGGDCDTEKTTVGAAAMATPTPSATVAVPTVRPAVPVAPPVAPAPPAPTGGQAPTLVAPMTGSGAESGAGGSQPLALALGLAGGCLLLLGGATMLRRPR